MAAQCALLTVVSYFARLDSIGTLGSTKTLPRIAVFFVVKLRPPSPSDTPRILVFQPSLSTITVVECGSLLTRRRA
jgi:hypothetical protein